MGYIIQPKFEPLNIKIYLTDTQHSYDGINYFPGGILTLNSAPVNIGLPASGVGYYYRVTQFDAVITPVLTPYTSVNLTIKPTLAAFGIQLRIPFLDFNQSVHMGNFNPTSPLQKIGFSDNDSLSLSADNDSLVGDSLVDVYIQVEKVKL